MYRNKLLTLFKLLLITTKAVLSFEKEHFTEHIRLDWRNVFQWGNGYMAAFNELQSSNTVLDFEDESDCECWEQLFYARGWNYAVRSVQLKNQ